ncbi:hypothetical protein F4824DRAFT_451968 [Ustulina deusta]|nr:hypothetical protein F4824DRAFT_451968 [Ustulina deusta]
MRLKDLNASVTNQQPLLGNRLLRSGVPSRDIVLPFPISLFGVLHVVLLFSWTEKHRLRHELFHAYTLLHNINSGAFKVPDPKPQHHHCFAAIFSLTRLAALMCYLCLLYCMPRCETAGW